MTYQWYTSQIEKGVIWNTPNNSTKHIAKRHLVTLFGHSHGGDPWRKGHCFDRTNPVRQATRSNFRWVWVLQSCQLWCHLIDIRDDNQRWSYHFKKRCHDSIRLQQIMLMNEWWPKVERAYESLYGHHRHSKWFCSWDPSNVQLYQRTHWWRWSSFPLHLCFLGTTCVTARRCQSPFGEPPFVTKVNTISTTWWPFFFHPFFFIRHSVSFFDHFICFIFWSHSRVELSYLGACGRDVAWLCPSCWHPTWPRTSRIPILCRSLAW